jgi:hypothetical protein
LSTTAPQAARQAPVAGTPVGTVHVFDPHPLNWLFITWNTMEEPVRTDHEGHIVLALAEEAIWREDGSFAVTVRAGARFQVPPRRRVRRRGRPDLRVSLPSAGRAGHGKVPRLSHRQPVVLADARFGYKKTGSGEGHW